MPVDPTILAVIPARGGSKGIPRKNLRLLCGRPLVQWTIDAARAARLLDRIVVSTEDAEIAALAARCGAEVLPRPPELATDTATTLEVVQQAVQVLPAGVVVVLQPTSPIRSRGLIDRCIRQWQAERADSLGTVHRDHSYEYGQAMPRRQEMRPRLVDNGNVYVLAADTVRRGHRFGARLATYEVSRPEGVEIDEEFDCWLAERILERGPEWLQAFVPAPAETDRVRAPA